MRRAKITFSIVFTILVIALFTLFSSGIAEQQVASTTVSINVTESFIQYLNQLRAQAAKATQAPQEPSATPSDSTVTIRPL